MESMQKKIQWFLRNIKILSFAYKRKLKHQWRKIVQRVAKIKQYNLLNWCKWGKPATLTPSRTVRGLEIGTAPGRAIWQYEQKHRDRPVTQQSHPRDLPYWRAHAGAVTLHQGSRTAQSMLCVAPRSWVSTKNGNALSVCQQRPVEYITAHAHSGTQLRHNKP